MTKFHRIAWDVIFPLIAFLMGLLSVNSILGITDAILLLFRHPSTFSSEDELLLYSTGLNPEFRDLEIISFFMPFDAMILIFAIAAFVLKKMCESSGSERQGMAKTGMVTAVVCFIISITPLGALNIFIPMVTYNFVYREAIDELRANEQGYFTAKEEDYVITDLEVIFSEDYGGYFVAAGTITNTTEHDWEYVTFDVWFTNVKDVNGHFVKDSDKIPKHITTGAKATCKIENLPAGGSSDFTSSRRFRNYISHTENYAKCKIFDLKYKIVLEANQL